jgi:hypothetical protein
MCEGPIDMQKDPLKFYMLQGVILTSTFNSTFIIDFGVFKPNDRDMSFRNGKP